MIYTECGKYKQELDRIFDFVKQFNQRGVKTMITNKELKRNLDNGIENLREAQKNIEDSLVVTRNYGLREDITGILMVVSKGLEELENLVYPPEPDPEVYEMVTDDKVVRFAEINSL